MEIITRLDAAKAGLKRYYTGKQCKRGHDSERYVYNGHCVTCAINTSLRRQAEIKQLMAEASLQHSS
ncbi:hypothetical protein DJ485_15345 [Citrobacter freundii]|uniref:hypothetical protein n=1 Tax=Citrobacter freundii TaxID=546 RepID=UPI0010A2FE95|nr:hypothetical protein [Citrobacter freundii]THE51696.1 hypothetical protein DJ485_15345 [Citrobacter freundii]